MASTGEIAIVPSTTYHRNAASPTNHAPCVICGKEITTPQWHVRVHHGGGWIVTNERAEWLNSHGREAADLYWHPIGADCLRRHPEYKPFAVRTSQTGA
jgi:hypothetical protein